MIQTEHVVDERWTFADFQETKEIHNIHESDAVFCVRDKLLHRLISCASKCDIVFKVFHQNVQDEVQMDAVIDEQLIAIVGDEEQSLTERGRIQSYGIAPECGAQYQIQLWCETTQEAGLKDELKNESVELGAKFDAVTLIYR